MDVSFDFDRKSRPAAPQHLHNVSDGDTPRILQPVRMVSVDTPEKAGYAGRPEVAQPKLDECRQRLESGFYPDIPAPLAGYLVDRLDGDAAARHIAAGDEASVRFSLLLADRLTRETGTRRRVATIPTGEAIDRYGRLLAYLAPWFSGTPTDPLPPPSDPARRTFNLDMVASGWAAPFLVYPSLPGNADLQLFLDDARAAWAGRRGAWEAHGETLLLGYEYRLCVKLGTEATAKDGMEAAFQRVCVDLRTLTAVGTTGWSDVPPPERLWVWLADRAAAGPDLGVDFGTS